MNNTYTINELSELTGLSRRTIRYYIQMGLISSPAGRGRGGFYNDSHVNSLLRIKELQESGASLSTIAESLKIKMSEDVSHNREVWVRQQITTGVEIYIRRDVEERQYKKVSELIRLAKTIFKGGD